MLYTIILAKIDLKEVMYKVPDIRWNHPNVCKRLNAITDIYYRYRVSFSYISSFSKHSFLSSAKLCQVE